MTRIKDDDGLIYTNVHIVNCNLLPTNKKSDLKEMECAILHSDDQGKGVNTHEIINDLKIPFDSTKVRHLEIDPNDDQWHIATTFIEDKDEKPVTHCKLYSQQVVGGKIKRLYCKDQETPF